MSVEEPAGTMPVDVDPIIHAVSRLRIMTVLVGFHPDARVAFSRLRTLLDMTPGNLLAQLQTLAAAGYVRLEQQGRGRNSRTSASVTPAGRAAYAQYARTIRALLNSPA